MSKRAEEAAENIGYIGISYKAVKIFKEGVKAGYEQAEKDYIELAQLWVGSGDANIMSFKQFLKCHETQSNK